MPPTRAAALVTDVFRRRLVNLRDATALEVVQMLDRLDFDVTPASLERQLEDWRRRSAVTAATAGAKAGEQSVAYLSAYLVASGASPLSVPVEPVQPRAPELTVVRNALLWRLGQGAGRAIAMQTAAATAKRVTRDTVGSGASRTLAAGIRREPQIDGWHRATSSVCCSRCADLTGVKYSDNDDFEAAHPACRCSPEPTVLARAETLRRLPPVITPGSVPKTQLTLNNLANQVGAEPKTQLKLTNIANQVGAEPKTQLKLTNIAKPAPVKAPAPVVSAPDPKLVAKQVALWAKNPAKAQVSLNALEKWPESFSPETRAMLLAAREQYTAGLSAAQTAATAAQVRRRREDARRFTRADEGRRYGAETWPGPEAYTARQLTALKAYTGDGYRRINDRLRRSSGESTTQQIRDMDAAMDRAPRVPEDLIVTRNADARSFGFEPGADLSKLEGRTVTEHGFLSTSINARGAMSGDVRINLNVPQGYKGIYVSGKPGQKQVISSVGGGETELILARGAQYTIRSVTRSGRRWIVEADIVEVP